jgi:phage gp36-like protein
MTFLTIDDFGMVIDLQIFKDIIDMPEVIGTPNQSQQAAINLANELLNDSELAAILEAKSHLSSRYLIDTDFAKTGNDRNQLLVLKTVDIALYNIHSILNPKQIPDIRIKRYDDAIAWCMQVNRGEINPVGLTKPTDGSKQAVQYGSNRKRDHYF